MKEVEFKVKIPEGLEKRMERCEWINWSKVALNSFSERLEEVKKAEMDSEFLVKGVLMKHEVLERYKQTGILTKEEEKFCEKIDWHPVDELPLKEEFVKRIKEVEKGPHSKPMTLSELNNWFDEL